MTTLFEFFLKIGARDFWSFYCDLKAAGHIRHVAVSYYLLRYLFYSLLAVVIALVILWVMGAVIFNPADGISFNPDLTIPVFFGALIALYIWWTLIEMIGNMAHVYSRGQVAKAEVMGTKSRMGRGFYVLLRFEHQGKVIEASFAKQIGQKSYWEAFPHDHLDVIHAKDKPELVMPYNADSFEKRCLDRTHDVPPE
ncbi:hypothetical protein [Kiloniella sp. EL199]|uniref:hypothetical protein n=1 Tax=Kiloniella sp. EL199 TaxID=2107581 RepID=UPI000EA1B1B2|nr:hypothetical protein [Kiloniella sp. EL199]